MSGKTPRPAGRRRNAAAPTPETPAVVVAAPVAEVAVTPVVESASVEVVAVPVIPTESAVTPVESTPAAPAKEVCIPQVRVRKLLTSSGLNATVCAQLDQLKPRAKAYHSAVSHLETGLITDVVETKEGDVVTRTRTERALTAEERAAFTATIDATKGDIATIANEINMLNGCKFRFSGDADKFVSRVCDALTRELALHAKKTARANNLKIVQVEHLYGEGLEKLNFFLLIAGTALYRETHSNSHSKKSQDALDAAITATAANTQKELRKKWREAGLLNPQPRKKEVAAPVDGAAVVAEVAAPVEIVAAPVAVEQPAAPETPEMRNAKSLQHFISSLVESAGGDEFKQMRKGSGLILHISELVRQFIARITSQLTHLMRLGGAKTVTRDHVRAIIQSMLTDGQTPNVTMVEVVNSVPEKAALKAEQEKMAAEKVAGRQYSINYEALPTVLVSSRSLVSTFDNAGYAIVEEIEKALTVKEAEKKRDAEAKKAAKVVA